VQAPSVAVTPSGTVVGGLTPADERYLERRVAAIAEEHDGMVPARVAHSMEAHHHVHVPAGQHGMLAIGSTLVMMDDRRDSVYVSVYLHEGSSSFFLLCGFFLRYVV
jgi:hypothetical protein